MISSLFFICLYWNIYLFCSQSFSNTTHKREIIRPDIYARAICLWHGSFWANKNNTHKVGHKTRHVEHRNAFTKIISCRFTQYIGVDLTRSLCRNFNWSYAQCISPFLSHWFEKLPKLPAPTYMEAAPEGSIIEFSGAGKLTTMVLPK